MWSIRHLSDHGDPVSPVAEGNGVLVMPRGELTGGPAILRDTGESARNFDWDSVGGSWPGDETIEELLDLLRELRSVR